MHNAACGGLGLGLGLRVRVRVRVRVREAPGSKSSSDLVAESRLARSTRNVSPNAMISCDVRDARRRKICSALPPPLVLEGWKVRPNGRLEALPPPRTRVRILQKFRRRSNAERASAAPPKSPLSVGRAPRLWNSNLCWCQLSGRRVSHSRSSRTCAERERRCLRGHTERPDLVPLSVSVSVRQACRGGSCWLGPDPERI